MIMKPDALKTLIRTTWAKALAVEEVGDHQDFFDLGATSITVIDVQYTIEEQTGLNISASALFERPTVDGWAQIISDLSENKQIKAQ